ncbi:uncharacterized protein LOC135077959 [Ostrinia nubilalis]|uniref:uncharacterized protein LOC135077959 n=1 Tax=Ostrinia nubilalis TaxID=29057 RepID=UPI0030822826
MGAKAYLLFVIIVCVDCSRIKKEGFRKNFRVRGETLEQLFAVYDPTFLAVVWPKISNGLHLDVSQFCWDDVSVFFKDLAEGRAWAFNVADASGRYQGGATGGATYWLGSRQRCSALDNNFLTRDHSDNSTSDDLFEGEYLMALLQREKIYSTGGHEWHNLVQSDDMIQRLVTIDNRPPYRLAYSIVTLRLNVTKITMTKSYGVTLGLCLPRSCSPDDIEAIVAFSIVINDNLKSNRTVPRVAKITSLRTVEDYHHIEEDAGAIVLICITAFLLILSIVATIVELNLIRCRMLKPRSSRSVSFNLQKYNNADPSKRYLDTIKKKPIDSLWKEHPLGKLNKIDDDVNMKPGVPPTITLDVMSMERAMGSCNRCGKYKRQCNGLPTHSENLSACPRVKYSSVVSLSTAERRSSFTKRLLMCFSLRYSWRRIFNTNMANKDLSVMHLTRVVATLWVIYVHVAMMVNYVADDAGEVNDRNEMYYVLATGTLAFDTLMFVSGLFSAHHFFYLKSHYSVEELVSFGGGCGHILQFVCFVTNRIIRCVYN